MTPDLEGEFHRKMLDTYDEAAKFGYRPTYFLRLVQEQGGLRAAKTPLRKGVSDGLTRLAKEGRLDISMEHLVLTPPFDQLFSEEEKELARWALKNAQNL